MSHDMRIDMVQPGVARVYVDGVQVKGVHRVAFDLEAGGQLAKVTLTLIPDTLEVSGLADVERKYASLA